MKNFTIVKGFAAVLKLDNIDTDMLIPKQFLKTVKRTGLGIHLFQEMRYTVDSQENPDFVLNREPYRKAKFLLAGKNFGCGSSREHAPWALEDFGIRVVLAESFADIFFNNTTKNGILAVPLEAQVLAQLCLAAERGEEFSADLERQVISTAGKDYPFEIDAFKCKCLLEGLDDIDLVLQHEQDISSYEAKLRQDRPWLA